MAMNGTMIIMALLAVVGVIMIITGNPLIWRRGNFPEENLKKFARATGVIFIILGLSGLGFGYTIHQAANEQMSWYVVLACLILMVGSVIAQIVVTKKYKKK